MTNHAKELAEAARRARGGGDVIAQPIPPGVHPIVYHLDDGKVARGLLVGPSAFQGHALLVVDLTFGDGPSVVGRPEWFDRGYVEAFGGLVSESAAMGTEPGQWEFGVLKCNRELDSYDAHPDDEVERLRSENERLRAAESAADDGCPVNDPDCIGRADECHIACEEKKEQENDDGG